MKLMVDYLIGELRNRFDQIADPRNGHNKQYPFVDIAMAAFSVFFMQSPSFLEHQRTGENKNACRSLFGIRKLRTAIIFESNWTDRLSGCLLGFDIALDQMKKYQALKPFQILDGRRLNSTTLTRFSVRNVAPDFGALARPNITISCCAPHWLASDTARCCRCARSSSRRKTAIKNRTAKPKPPAGSIKTQRATHLCVRFTWSMICMPVSRCAKRVTEAGGDFIFRKKVLIRHFSVIWMVLPGQPGGWSKKHPDANAEFDLSVSLCQSPNLD